MKKGPRIARANTDRVWTERGKPSRDNITAVMLKKNKAHLFENSKIDI